MRWARYVAREGEVINVYILIEKPEGKRPRRRLERRKDNIKIYLEEIGSVDLSKKKVKLSRYRPWRHKGGEEEKLLLILNLGTRWG
jgi:hypothetical protein